MGKINLHNYEAFLIDYLDGNLNEASVMELKAFLLANPQLKIDLADLDLPSFTNDDTKIDFKNELKRSETFIEDEELINYVENNLPEAERKAFELKVLNNKELVLKLEAYKNTILNPDTSFVTPKIDLYKTNDDLVLNNIVLAYFEDQLSISDKSDFEKELKNNPAFQKEISLFERTKLQPDNGIVFVDKEALKKEAKVIALFSFRAVASVAAAILLLIGLAFVFNYYNSKPVLAKELAKNNFNKAVNNIKNHLVKSIDSSNGLNKNIADNTYSIAKKTGKENKKQWNNNSFNLGFNEPKTNSVAANKEKKEVEQGSDKEPENENKPVFANNKLAVDSNSIAVANTNLNESNSSKQTSLIAVEEADDDDNIAVAPVKKGFWQRAVKIAKQVNKLGVKAIDGEESQGKNYALSFNSFSVEKR